MHARRVAIATLSVAALLLAAGCTHQQEINTETQLAKQIVPTDQENALGNQVEQDLSKQHVKYATDPVVTSYVEGIANKIFAEAKKDRGDVNWHVHVIDDPKTVNAFSVPGGHMFVYTGLLLAAQNDAQIAGVLGHEAGHVVARHAARSLVNVYGLQAIAGLALGQNPTQLEQIATSIVGNGYLLAHSRGEENEADTYGARYAAGAGYDPSALISFFQILQSKEGKTPQIMTYLSDHPATSDRIKRLTSYIASKHLAGGTLGNTDLSAIKQRLGGAAAAGG